MAETESAQRQAVIAEAESWLRTPYHHHGFVKHGGVDCAFLLICVFHNVGLIPWIDPRPYAPDWHLHRREEKYLGWVEKYCRRVEVPQPGDIALFRFGHCAAHGAIVVEWPIVIHSILGRGVELCDAQNSELAHRFDSFWTVWGD